MTITRMQRVVVDALEDIKAQDIRVYDTSAMTELFDRVVVATATSNRQTRALAHHVRDTAKSKGYDVISTEGEDTGEWVLVDLGDVVVHIMQPAIRQYYNLEELWGEKPVRMRIGGPASPRSGARLTNLKPSLADLGDDADDDGAAMNPATASAALSDAGDDEEPRRASGGRALKSALPRTPQAKRPTTRTTAKTGAAKTGAAKSATTRTAGTKTAGTRSAGTKTAGAKTAGTKSATARTAAKKPAAPRPRVRTPRD